MCPPARPAASCPACGRPVDALRAGQVAIEKGQFVYFCDRACKKDYLTRENAQLDGTTLEPPPVAPAPPKVEILPAPAPAPVPVPVPVPATPTPTPTPPAAMPPVEQPAAAVATPTPPAAMPPIEQPAAAAATPSLSLTDHAALLSFLLFLPSAFLSLPSAVSFLAFVCTALAVAAALLAPRPLRALVPGGLAFFVAPPIALAILVAATGTIASGRAASAAATACLVALALLRRLGEPLERERARILAALDGDVTVAEPGAVTEVVSASKVKAGQRVRAAAGETVRVDGVVVAGEARVRPWLGAKYTEPRAPNDAVIAGAVVEEGEIFILASWTADDRAVARSLTHPAARLDRGATVLVRLRPIVAWAPFAVVLVVGLSVALSTRLVDGAVVAAACAAAIPAVYVWAAAAITFARAARDALERGIFYRDATSFDAAGRVERVALCSGSALMAGVPEVVQVESVGGTSTAEIIKLAASAEAAASHAVGRAILRATTAPRVALRTVMAHPGLGVTAQSPSGERIVVGNRTLCMRESVSAALAEDRIAELERKGRIVVLVALGGRLVGWIALQDDLAPGARACVEALMTARVEPVLLTGAARATAEALAEALGIEHVRPEVIPDDRGAEVRALATSGASVAAIGSPKTDDGALGAAGVSVALGAAGAPAGEWTIAVATARADAAAAAIVLARRARDRVRSVLVPGTLPGLVAALGLATSLVPADYAFFAPLLGTVGTVISWWIARVDS